MEGEIGFKEESAMEAERDGGRRNGGRARSSERMQSRESV